MAAPSLPCDPGRLRLLLEDRLLDDEQEALAGHLEACASCREALERLAAETRWWSDVKDLAAPEPLPSGGAGAPEPASDANPVSIPPGFLAPVDDPECLGKIGAYEVHEIIGRGGNGLVLRALDPALRRLVAIKVLAPELATSAAARRRFAREARAAAAVTHEHVVAIHGVDTAPNGLPYLVMTYVAGKSLQERLDRSGALEVEEILRIGMQTASGLAAAHAQGLVHRDIKPANILLENGMERVKLTDFGLARAADDASVSQSGLVAGTPQYMAPEQARGEVVDHRADLFSLGSVMYAMATGRPPFRADSTLAVLRRVSNDPPRPIREINPEIPEWLSDIIARLHEKDPARRFQSATEVAELLGRCLAFIQNPTDRVPPYRRVPSSASVALRRWALPLAALVIVGLGVGASEATGITHLVARVLHVQLGDTTLVLETEEPGVDIEVDGKRVPAAEPGEHPIRVEPGRHNLRASKDGVPLMATSITITRGQQRIVTISVDPRERMKSQDEYTASLTKPPQPALPTEEPTSAVDPAEYARLQNELKYLKDRDRRNQARLEALEHEGASKPHVGVANGMLQAGPAADATNSSAQNGALGTFLSGVSGGATADGSVTPVERKTPAPKPSATLAKLGEPVTLLGCASDGQTLLFATGRALRALDRNAVNSSPRTLAKHEGQVTSLAVSASESIAASGSTDGTVLLSDVAGGQTKGEMKDLGGAVFSLDFSPDGNALAIALEGGQVRIVDARSGALIRELPKQSTPVLIVRYSPDGKLLATAGGIEDFTQPGAVKLWDAETGVEKASLDGHRYRVKALAFSRDGPELAVGDMPPAGRGTGSHIYVWDVVKLSRVQDHYIPSGVEGLAYSPDGDTLAATSHSGRLYVYQVVEGQEPTMSDVSAHSGPAPGLAFEAQDGTLVTGGKDGTIKLWTLTSVNVPLPSRQYIPLSEPLAIFRDGMGERIWSADFSPDGKTLAACYTVNAPEDGEIGEGSGGLALWNPISGNLQNTILAPHVIRSLAFTSRGDRIATAEFDSAVSLRSASDGHVLKTFAVSSKGTNAVAFSHDDRLLAAAGLDGLVYVWDVASGREAARLKDQGGEVYTVAFSTDDKAIASGGADTDALLWDLSTGKVRWTLEGHEGAIEHLAFSPDGKTMATASWDQSVMLWDVTTGKELRTFRGHRWPVLGLAFSASGEYLATCAGTWGADKAGPGAGELILWDLVKRRALTPPLSYPKRLLGVSFSPNPKTFATAAWDGSVRLWNVDSVSSPNVAAPALAPVETAAPAQAR